MKKCATCQTDKPTSEFNSHSRRKDGLQTSCKDCNKTKSKEYYLKNKKKHRKVTAANRKADRKKIQLALRKLKNVPCKDCGKKYPYYVMDFDHLENKDFIMSKAHQWGFKRAMIEVKKCEIVCANCHRERTHSRGVAQ